MIKISGELPIQHDMIQPNNHMTTIVYMWTFSPYYWNTSHDDDLISNDISIIMIMNLYWVHTLFVATSQDTYELWFIKGWKLDVSKSAISNNWQTQNSSPLYVLSS